MTEPEAEPVPVPVMPAHLIDRPELLPTARLWPVVDPDVSDTDTRRLRKALRRGAFKTSGTGPGSSDVPQRLDVTLTATGVVTAVVAVGSFVAAAYASGLWAVLLVVLCVLATLPAAWIAGAGCVYAWRVVRRRNRLIRRLRERFLLPRHFGPEYARLVERAALATETIALDDHAGLGADDRFFRLRLWQTVGQARLAWNLRRVLAPAGGESGAGNGGEGEGDEVVAEVLARATEAVDQVAQAVADDVRALEQMAALLTEVRAARDQVNRLDGVRLRTAQIAKMIAEARGDQPDLAGEVLSKRTDEARERYVELLRQAHGLRSEFPEEP